MAIALVQLKPRESAAQHLPRSRDTQDGVLVRVQLSLESAGLGGMPGRAPACSPGVESNERCNTVSPSASYVPCMNMCIDGAAGQ